MIHQNQEFALRLQTPIATLFKRFVDPIFRPMIRGLMNTIPTPQFVIDSVKKAAGEKLKNLIHLPDTSKVADTLTRKFEDMVFPETCEPLPTIIHHTIVT